MTSNGKQPLGVLSRRSSSAAATVFWVAAVVAMSMSSVVAEDFQVSPDGQPFSIAQALDVAGPGDSVVLSDGVYSDPILTVRSGEEGSPISITGGSGAIISGAFDDRAITVKHSWISLEGFMVDGQISDEDSASSFIDKCVFVYGEEDPIVGFSMQGMTVRNCGGECVRLKQFVTNSEIIDNDVSYCGVHDYRYNEGDKNGEAIYIGTSSKQWEDGIPDKSAHNVVRGNTLTPYGNECVDIKEGSYDNLVENNVCREQYDDDSGCYGSRGDSNVFRGNTGDGCAGAGIRLGGWEVDGEVYGQHCDVFDNHFTNTGTGVVVARQLPQGAVCGNSCSDSVCDVVGDSDIEEKWDQPCLDIPDAVGSPEDDDEITFTAGDDADGDDDDQEQDKEEEGEDGEQQEEQEQEEQEEQEQEPEPEGELEQEGDGEEGEEEGEEEEEESPVPPEEEEEGDEGVVVGTGDDSSSSGLGGHEDSGSSELSCQPLEILPSYLTFSESTQMANPATNMIDGSLDTRWSAEGSASWVAIDLPAAAPLSSVALAFEDGDERTQDFDIVVVTDHDVLTNFYTSSGDTADFQQFSSFAAGGDLMAKAVMVVGYGNSVNDWNSITEMKLCAGDVASISGVSRRRASRQLSNTYTGMVTAAADVVSETEGAGDTTTTAAAAAGSTSKDTSNVNLRGSRRRRNLE